MQLPSVVSLWLTSCLHIQFIHSLAGCIIVQVVLLHCGFPLSSAAIGVSTDLGHQCVVEHTSWPAGTWLTFFVYQSAGRMLWAYPLPTTVLPSPPTELVNIVKHKWNYTNKNKWDNLLALPCPNNQQIIKELRFTHAAAIWGTVGVHNWD